MKLKHCGETILQRWIPYLQLERKLRCPQSQFRSWAPRKTWAFLTPTWNQLARVSTCPKMLCLCQCRISADSSLLASPTHLYRVVSCQVQASASLLVLLAAPFQIVQMVWCWTQANLSLLIFLGVHLQIYQMTVHYWLRTCPFLRFVPAAPMRACCVPRFWVNQRYSFRRHIRWWDIGSWSSTSRFDFFGSSILLCI